LNVLQDCTSNVALNDAAITVPAANTTAAVSYRNSAEPSNPTAVLTRNSAEPSNPTAVLTRNSDQVSNPDQIRNSPQKIYTPTWKWMVILAMLNGQCFFQYPITVVQWMYIGRATERPAVVIAVCLPISFLCGAIGGVWPVLLARDRKKSLNV
jgi:hypothetical protein